MIGLLIDLFLLAVAFYLTVRAIISTKQALVGFYKKHLR